MMSKQYDEFYTLEDDILACEKNWFRTPFKIDPVELAHLAMIGHSAHPSASHAVDYAARVIDASRRFSERNEKLNADEAAENAELAAIGLVPNSQVAYPEAIKAITSQDKLSRAEIDYTDFVRIAYGELGFRGPGQRDIPKPYTQEQCGEWLKSLGTVDPKIRAKGMSAKEVLAAQKLYRTLLDEGKLGKKRFAGKKDLRRKKPQPEPKAPVSLPKGKRSGPSGRPTSPEVSA